MAIVLAVHLVESNWARPKQSGLLAPYLVVDHNGQQQQTDIVRAANVTAWNQKATFPYVPTSDLVIMAFDAGRHPGAFVAQATVDVASMLQAGSLSASAPLVDSMGTTMGHVLFDVELSTSSLAIAASLDIPGLTVTVPQHSITHSNSRQMQPAIGARLADHLQEEHLSGSFTSFTMPSMHQKQQALTQQQQMQQHHAGGSRGMYDGAVEGVPHQQQPQLTRQLTRQFSSKIARGAQGLGSMLGLSMKRRSVEEPPVAAAAAAAVPRPVSPFAAMAGSAAAAPGLPADAQAGFDSLPESAGPLPCSLRAKRNSYLTSSNSFSSATAPPLPPGYCAAAAGGAGGGPLTFAAAAAGTAGMGVTDSVQLLAAGSRMLQQQRSRYSSCASDSSSVQCTATEAAAQGRRPAGLRASCSMSSNSAAADHHNHHHQQQQQQRRRSAGMLCAGGPNPGTATEVLSPLRSSRKQLKLSPSKMVQHAAVQHQQLLHGRSRRSVCCSRQRRPCSSCRGVAQQEAGALGMKI
ncbi:hypothetical protein COO60DRAFT_556012 [Scenedesmus sp. NREL 46B-D3]|nr:hypothetical protein COO60DRAFT_556012 [Scenedesmus sp. NREL 46B-D3]